MTSRSLLLLAASAVLAAGYAPVRAEPPAADGAAGVFRVWLPGETGSTGSGEALPLTAAARAAARLSASLTATDAGTDTDGAAATVSTAADGRARGCEAPGMPVMLDTISPVEFVDDGDRVVMHFEEWDAERIIYMNPAAGPPQQAHSPRGVSFGRWEGDTLAIFTLYIDYPYFDRQGTPQSRDVTVLERYTPSPDGERLDWTYTVTDAATFETPVTRKGYFAAVPPDLPAPVRC